MILRKIEIQSICGVKEKLSTSDRPPTGEIQVSSLSFLLPSF